MKLNPIINSLLETDAYKFNMGNIIFKKFNDYTTTWSFKCRNTDVHFTDEMIQEIKEQIDYFCNLKFTNDELNWLKANFPWLSPGYINFLKFWNPDKNEIFVNDNTNGSYNDCGLTIEARGTWFNTSMYEIPVLAIVNEVYFAFKYGVNAKEVFIEAAKLLYGEHLKYKERKFDKNLSDNEKVPMPVKVTKK